MRQTILSEFKGAADVEVEHCDVKELGNLPFAVTGFWLKAMCAHSAVAAKI